MMMLLCIVNEAASQNVPFGFNYQTAVRNSAGMEIISQPVSLRFSFYANSPTGPLVWQEDHQGATDSSGIIRIIIGTGLPTGAGTSPAFSQVNWASSYFFLKVSLDASGGSSYTDMGTSKLFSVPYAFYSLTTRLAINATIARMQDADLTGISPGKMLKWNGSFWVPAIDEHSDTVSFAFNSANSLTADTSLYSYGSPSGDTVLFAFNSDSSVYSPASGSSVNTVNSSYSDTALFAYTSGADVWRITGNQGSNIYFAGTTDSADLVIKTNSVTRVVVQSNGNVSLGSTTGISALNLSGDDGFVSSGVFGSLFNPSAGSGTRLTWYPSEGSFRAGAVNGTQWDTVNTGQYSMAFGYNTKSRDRSFTSGFECESVDYSFSSGRRSRATPVGPYPEGNSIALGDSCQSLSYRNVTIGRNNIATGAINVLIGYENSSNTSQSVCIGNFCNSGGSRSTVLGYHGNTVTLKSGFVYADASSSASTTPALAFQFVVRASGGYVFYTDTLNTMGVTLFPGSGSWSVISDRNKKENISDVNYENILTGINDLRIRSWNYRSQDKYIRHIGPFAQDFYKIFGFGENAVSISNTDMDGVILSGIKALDKRMDVLEEKLETEDLKARLKQLNDSAELEKRIEAIEQNLNNR
jgi:hypothetical protein